MDKAMAETLESKHAAFHPLVMLLRFKRHRRDRPSLETAERDRLTRHLAIAILAFVKAADRAIDLRDQFALAVASPELDSPVRLARSAIGKIGLAKRIDL